MGVVIGANAVLLGPIRVGRGAKIGAGAVVRGNVPPGAIVLPGDPRLTIKPQRASPLHRVKEQHLAGAGI